MHRQKRLQPFSRVVAVVVAPAVAAPAVRRMTRVVAAVDRSQVQVVVVLVATADRKMNRKSQTRSPQSDV